MTSRAPESFDDWGALPVGQLCLGTFLVGYGKLFLYYIF